jgi:hypothetical protein
MNRKILGIAVTILAVAMLASPVMAYSSANKTPVMATNIELTGADYVPSRDRWTSGQDMIIHHNSGLYKAWGTIDIYVDDVLTYENVEFIDTIYAVYNKYTLQVVARFEEVWTLPGGTFEGTAHIMTEGGSLSSYQVLDSHIILKGTGDYEGETMSLLAHYVKGVDPFKLVYEGYWLTP